MAEQSAQGRQGVLIAYLECEAPEYARIEADYIRRLDNGLIVVKHKNSYVNTGLVNSLNREFGLGGTAVGWIGVDVDTSAVTAGTTFLHGSANTPSPSTTLNGAVTLGAANFVVTSATNVQVGMGYVIQAGGGTVEQGVVGSISTNTITPASTLTVSGSTYTYASTMQSAHNTGTAVVFVGQSIKAISPAATLSAQTVTGGATFTNSDFSAGTPTAANAPCKFNKIGFLNTATDAGTGLIDVIGGTGGTAPYNRTFALDLTGVGAFTAVLQLAVTAVAL